jgi:hypothetical protein
MSFRVSTVATQVGLRQTYYMTEIGRDLWSQFYEESPQIGRALITTTPIYNLDSPEYFAI